jgi:hypothetical protein
MTAETTRTLKAILRKQFPACKFSITRGGEYITWTDDGPTQVAVEDAIIAAGLVEIHHGYDNKRWLRLREYGGNSIYLDRYNAAERAAELQNAERRRTQWREQQQHAEAAVAAARQTKCDAVAALQHHPSERDDSQLQAAYGAFDLLRQRAEAAVAIEQEQQERERRPSWAPPLTLDGELLELCIALGYLAPDAAPIARLWASYADPKRSRTVLRDTISTLPLSGIACRGFQLFAGSERGNSGDLLFEAQRAEAGVWRFGPKIYSTFFAPSSKWEQLTRDRATAEHRLAEFGDTHLRDEIARLTRLVAEIDAQDLATANKRRLHSEQRTRVLQLAQQRVLEFVGAPDAQMQAAARLCGHCCICFKALTDPISLERGIGPDCYATCVNFIRINAGASVELLARVTGMPPAFVAEVINERGIGCQQEQES